MLPLEDCRHNYFYDDWDAVEGSVLLAGDVSADSREGDEVLRAKAVTASLLDQGALFKRTHAINFRVCPDALDMPGTLIDEIEDLGRVTDRFLSAVTDTLIEQPSFRNRLGFPACPEELRLLELHRDRPLDFFRLDLAPDEDEKPKLLEIQIVLGGLGITQALRHAYGKHDRLPGAAEAYGEAVRTSYEILRQNFEKPSSGVPLIAVFGADRSAYRHDHLVLSRHLQGMELAVAPMRSMGFTSDGRPTLPDGRSPDVLHRLFRSPGVFEKSPKRAGAILDAVERGLIMVVNPWNDVLEDKRLLAFGYKPEIEKSLQDKLSEEDRAKLRQWIPETGFADPETIADIIGLPKSERAYYLKKGRSYESRFLYDGRQINHRKWEAACIEAKRDGDWIVQEAVAADPRPFRYLDAPTGAIRDMKGYQRISPYYFRSKDGTVRLGDILITAREERSRVHGASDAIMVVPG